MKKQNILILIVLLTAALGLHAETVGVSYNIEGKAPSGFGLGRTGLCDVCVRLDAPTLAGMRVRGISVPLPDNGFGTVGSEFAAWVGTTLAAEGEPADDSLASARGVVEGNILTLEFPQPPLIPEGGVYVGYTLDVLTLEGASQNYPVAVVRGDTPGGLYVRCRDSRPRWVNVPGRNERVSAMTVFIDGDFTPAMASPSFPEETYAAAGTTFPLDVMVSNHGTAPLASFSYTYTFPDASGGNGTYVLDTPLPAVFGASTTVSLPIEGPADTGDMPMTLTLTEVNGEPNSDAGAAYVSTLSVLPFLPVNRPLVEEYTGLWCGACPAGYVALEQGRHYHGDDFVAIALHYNDPMQTPGRTPQRATSYPSVFINRGSDTGASNTLFSWEQTRAELAPVDIAIALRWADESRTTLAATATARFLDSRSRHDLRFAFALVADHLSDPSWAQTNYFAGQQQGGLFWDLFTQGGAYVRGLEYNDVLLMYDDCLGVKGSLPPSIRACESYTADCAFPLGNARNVSGEILATNPADLRIIAMVIDAETNRVLNSVSSAYPDADTPAGVQSVENEKENPVIQTRYIGFDGCPLSMPLPGVPYIRLRLHADGTVNADKCL